MKKYLITYEEDSRGVMLEHAAEELPPGARVLTREEVDKVLADYLGVDTSNDILDDLFGHALASNKGKI